MEGSATRAVSDPSDDVLIVWCDPIPLRPERSRTTPRRFAPGGSGAISRRSAPYGCAAVGTLVVMMLFVAFARALVVFQRATMIKVIIVIIRVAPTTNSTISVPLLSL